MHTESRMASCHQRRHRPRSATPAMFCAGRHRRSGRPGVHSTWQIGIQLAMPKKSRFSTSSLVPTCRAWKRPFRSCLRHAQAKFCPCRSSIKPGQLGNEGKPSEAGSCSGEATQPLTWNWAPPPSTKTPARSRSYCVVHTVNWCR